MRVLLDTPALLWWLADDPRLGPAARAQIADGETQVLVSAASAWEIEIKRALGKLQAPLELAGALARNGFEPLAIGVEHAILAGRLPPHHGDPFDRILIAQARSEHCVIVTKDAAFQAYGVATLDATS